VGADVVTGWRYRADTEGMSMSPTMELGLAYAIVTLGFFKGG
jgi:hypothetical protein